MSKIVIVANTLNWMLLALLVVSVAGFISFQNIYGFFLASVTALIAVGVYKNYHLAYFAAAAWGLACYQLAKQGYEFKEVRHQVMAAGFIVIPVAIFLHEILAKRNPKNARKSVTESSKNRNMPD